MSGTSNPPPGWYPNPERPGTLRYWNGELWTEHVHDQQTPQAPAAALPGPPPPVGQQYGQQFGQPYGQPYGQQFGQPYGQFAYAGAPGGPPESPGFIGAFKDAMTNYVKFDGRLSLGGYWRFNAVNAAIWIGTLLLAVVADILVLLWTIYFFGSMLPSLSAAVRRLHDSDKSGLLVLVGLIPMVGWIIVIVLLAQSGTPGPNQYGPKPNT